MAYKLGFILSTVFLMAVLLLGGDLCVVNSLYQQVDATALLVSHRISMEGYLSEKTIQYVASVGDEIVALTSGTPAIGEIFTFRVERAYTPLILRRTPMTIAATRSCVVGFYKTSQF